MAAKRNGRDYVGIADAYARDAISDVEGKRHCHWMRLAASRYLKDRKRATEKTAPFVFAKKHARQVCSFIEQLPHVEGKWETPTICLHRSHIFFLVNLFGFRNPGDTRRFTSALFAVARKNAKSTLAAAILLYCLCYEQEPGPQVITAATTGDQARVIFNIAKRMVEQTPDLRDAFDLEVFAGAITSWSAGGNLRPINAHASTQDGLNPSVVALDEIHAHKNHDLLNVLQSAAGARMHALWLYTTTEGYETPGPWPEMRLYAQQVLSGLIDAEHFFPLIFSLDDQVGSPGEVGYRPADEDFDETKWVKANPLMEVNPILEREIRKAAADARVMPGRHAEFKIKRLNRQATAANTWLNIERWKRCNRPVDLDWLEGKECWAALDGAATTDLMAFRLVWRVEGVVYTWGRRWVPEGAVAQRTERGTVPYAAWVASGFITMLPGNVIDYAAVERDILALCQRFKPKVIAYDSWNIRDLVNRLIAAEMPMQEFRQGPRSYNPAMQETERLYLSEQLHHGGDPVLNWCASNVTPRYDENLNMAPDKKRSADKIDDACALFMGVGVMGVPTQPKKFQLMFV